MLKRTLMSAVLALNIGAAMLRAETEKMTDANTETAQANQVANKPVKDPTAQLRGKLLYKKSQARKLEKAAEEADPALKSKIVDLHTQAETAYVAANPKLAEIYQEQKELTERLDNLTATSAD